MAAEFFIPKLGQTVEEVTLVKWLLADGAQVTQGQDILEVETDKAVFPLEANAKGYLHLGPYPEGGVVPVLTVVALIGGPDDKFEIKASTTGEPEAPTRPAVEGPLPGDGGQLVTRENQVFASPRARKLAHAKGVDLALVQPTGGGGVRVAERDVVAYLGQAPRATPLAKKVAAEAGVDLRQVPGTGPHGKIVREDVTRAAAPPPEDEVLERVPLKGVRRLIAERMADSAHTTARVTLFMEVDATEFVAARNRLRERVETEWGFAPSYNDLLAKIVALALRKFPGLNARLTPDAIELLRPVNLGLAVDTERGLLVPVVHDADRKSLRQLGAEFRELADRARLGRALPADLSGGTFTITNLGMYDVDAFTPVINLPEAAILGVGRIVPKPVALNDQVVIRQRWNLCLVFDHRLADGAPAARFLQYIKQLIEEPYLLIAL
jgi:pyruvate dehydrogenase E2 component (dihydrolipoamide acetyltransferase)